MSASGEDPLVGRVLDERYRVERLLGGGGMGRVYDAVQVDLGRRVALKVLVPELARQPNILERFRREALAAAVLGHPHIVNVTDFRAPKEGPPFLVMERLVGEPLMDVLQRDGRLEPARAVRIAVQLLDALQEAHEAGIVHRDLKPANVFLVSLAADQEMAKLLDFGVAKLEEGPGSRKLTGVGEMVGTPRFAAPEQLKGGEVDARTDVYGVGVLLYGMLTGRPPFTGPMEDLIRSILEDTPVDVRVVAPEIDPMLAEVVNRAMAKAPDERFASAAEMIEALGGRRAKASERTPRSTAGLLGARPAGGEPRGGRAKSSGVAALVGAGMFVAGLVLASAAWGALLLAGAWDPAGETPVKRASASAGAPMEACDAYVAAACACEGASGARVCERARATVGELRRSVGEDPSEVTGAERWCRDSMRGEVCALDTEQLVGVPPSVTLGAGPRSSTLGSDDPARHDGASTERFGLTLFTGERVEVRMKSSAFDAYLVLRDPDGQIVAVNDDATDEAEGTDARIAYLPRRDGDYVLEAGAAAPEERGEYQLEVAFPSSAAGARRAPRPARRRPTGASAGPAPALPEPWEQRGPRGRPPPDRRSGGAWQSEAVDDW